MLKSLDQEVIQVMMTDPKKRKIICAKSFIYFAVYYFPDFFKYEIPPFHYLMYNDLQDMLLGACKFLLWIMFRESAKTSITKMFVTWCIVYSKKSYIIWDSYDKQNSVAALFDVSNFLLYNKRIVRDFGEFYFEKRSNEEKQLKKVEEFITTNGIKVMAVSVGESVRGLIQGSKRPDLVVMDDFETMKTVMSFALIRKIKAHMDELRGGLSVDGNVIYLCNLLSEAGVVQDLISASEKDPDLRMRKVNVQDGHDQIVWKDKYVHTDKEAMKANSSITDPKRRKVSLESKKRSMNAEGRKVYEVEMMNSPEAAGSMIFDRAIIERLIKACEKPLDVVAGFATWAKYNPAHSYGMGADTAKGVGRDACASVLVDFTVYPARQIGSYANNEIAPDTFSHELTRQGKKFDFPYLGIEENNTGFATITAIKPLYPVDKLYRQRAEKKAIAKPTLKIGWQTNAATKPKMIFELKSAVEDGILVIEDIRILKEMRAFTLTDLEDTSDESETTRHFDLLMACAIAWQMKNYVYKSVSQQRRESKPLPPVEPISFGGQATAPKPTSFNPADYDYSETGSQEQFETQEEFERPDPITF